jgi:hypothetical protein
MSRRIVPGSKPRPKIILFEIRIEVFWRPLMVTYTCLDSTCVVAYHEMKNTPLRVLCSAKPGMPHGF